MRLEPAPRSEEARLTRLSATWPDRLERLERLRAALEVAGEDPPVVDRANALDWIETQLADSHDGLAMVVFHSILWQYFSYAERRGLVEVLGRRGGAPHDGRRLPGFD